MWPSKSLAILALLGLCHQISLGIAQPFQPLASQEPRAYTDEMLPRPVTPSGVKIDHLNTTVMKLDVRLKPSWSASVRANFTIVNNRRLPVTDGSGRPGLFINPGTYVTLHRGAHNHFGPYHFDLDAILSSGFDPKQRTVVLIPGFLSPSEQDWIREARIKWLELDPDANVIQVGWSQPIWSSYWGAVANSVLVARQLTILIHYLAELAGTNLKDGEFLGRFQLVGHSCGAHISGFVGQDLAGQVGRITGLDPAGPEFDLLHNNQRLDKSDARLVEVVHTNGGQMKYLNLFGSALLQALGTVTLADKLINSDSLAYSGEGDTAWFGIDENIGHVDYYANNGRTQEGCKSLIHLCDHNRAYAIYNDILGFQCALKKSDWSSSQLAIGEGNDQRVEQAKLTRLNAFKSADYESFVTGANFITNCPELMDMQTHLDDELVYKSYKKCSFPLLDMLKPIDELIEELETDYDLQNAHRSRFYFKTSADDDDLVGDHYILKIYLSDEPLWDSEVCSLKVRITMNDDQMVWLELNRALQPSSDQRVLAVPYVFPKSLKFSQRFHSLMRILLQSKNFTASQPDQRPPEFDRMFQELFPAKILLTMGKPKSRSVFGTVKGVTAKMIKQSDAPPPCSMTVEMIEVHPIVYGFGRSLGALYGRDLFLGAEDNETLPILSAADQLRRLRQPDKFVATLSVDSMRSIGVGLEAAVLS